MADNTQTLGFAGVEEEISLDQLSPEYQEQLISSKVQLQKLIEEQRKEVTKEAGAGAGKEIVPNIFQIAAGLPSGAPIVEEAVKIALENKMKIISDSIGEPVTNSDWSNLTDATLLWDLSRSKSFKNRKKKFHERYPDGQFLRNQVNVGDRTLNLEFYKYNKDDPEFRLVDPFGLDYSDFARVAGLLLDEQLAMEGVGLVAGTAGAAIPGVNPTTGVMAGSWLGLKMKKFNESLRGYGEEEFDDGFDMEQFFLDKDDWISAAMSGTFYKLTKEAGDYLFKGKRPGTIDITENLVKAADKLGMDPLIFAQLAVNPQVRNIFSQAEGFTAFVNDLREGQIESIIKSFKTDKNPFKNLNIEGPQQIDMQDLINVQSWLANDVKKKLKVNFSIKDGLIDNAAANKALSDTVNNFNAVNTKFQTRYMNKAITAAENSNDGFINTTGFNQVVNREINKLLSGVTTQDKIVKRAGQEVLIPSQTYKQSYKSIKDLPKEFARIKANLKAMGNNIHTNEKGAMVNFKTLYTMRNDLHKLMHHENEAINLAAKKMHKSIVDLMESAGKKNGKIGGSDEFVLNTQILNSQVANAEVVNGMDMIRDAFVKGNDLDGFVQNYIKPGNTNNILAIKEMLRLPDDASQADKNASKKLFDTMKNFWIANTVKSDTGAQKLQDFLINDPDSLKVLLGPNYEQKALELQDIIKAQNKVEQGIAGQMINNKGTPKEFMSNIIEDASKGKYGTSNSMDELIVDLGGFDGPVVNDIRNNILKDLFDKSLMVNTKTGKKQFQETLDLKKFDDNLVKLRKDTNLMKFFNEEQIEALRAYEQYSRSIAGNLGVGGELAKAEQTAQIIQKFQLVGAGLNIVKYHVAAKLLSKPITAGLLKDLTPDGWSSNNAKILLTALTKAEGEVYEESTGKNKLNDQGILDVIEEDDDRQSSNVVPTMAPTPNVTFNPSPVNEVSRLSNANIANPVGMRGVGNINPNTMARGSQLFNKPNEITFAAQGGIMNARKPIQRVA